MRYEVNQRTFTFSSYTQTQSNGMLTHRPWAASGLSAPRWEPARQRGKTTAAPPTWSGHSSRTRSWRQERHAGSHSEYTSKHTSLGWDIRLFFSHPSICSLTLLSINTQEDCSKANWTDSRLHCEIEWSRKANPCKQTGSLFVSKILF